MEKNIFSRDYKSEDFKTKSSNYGDFGLNQNAEVIFLGYNPNGGKDGTAADCFEINVKIGDGTYSSRVYPVSPNEPIQTFVDSKKVELQPGTDEHKQELIARTEEGVAFIKHCVRPFFSNDIVNSKIELMTAPTLGSFIKDSIGSLIPNPKEGGKKVDVFLEYQWNIREGKKRTYPVLPKNLKGGDFIARATTSKFKEVIDENGNLSYMDESNNIHVFKRDKGFMESNKGQVQTLDNTDVSGGAFGGSSSSADSTDSLSTWE